MLLDGLKNIVAKAKLTNKSSLYIRSLLKEYLQVYVLNFIYTNPEYNRKLIFTGGTCLRHCFGLNRLSEDLDFDLVTFVDRQNFKKELGEYFRSNVLYTEVEISVLQKGRQMLLKFPVLKTLGLATGSESDLLYVKLDLSEIASNSYKTLTTLKSYYDLNFIVTNYDLPSLLAGKIAAILSRVRFVGRENMEIVKGRDYFDLLWFLDKETVFDIKRVNDLLNSNYSISEAIDLLDKKVHLAVTKYRQFLKQDLIPFIDNPLLLDGYIENYQKNYNNSKRYLLKS